MMNRFVTPASDHQRMQDDVFIGTERMAQGGLTRAHLRWNYRSIFPGVYTPKLAQASLRTRTVGAWLWADRDCVIAGRAAAALHGAEWIDAATPVELIGDHCRSPSGLIVRNERIDSDEVVQIDGLPVTSVARTAVDLGRYLPRDHAVGHLDALGRATGFSAVDAKSSIHRHPRARGLRRAAVALDLMDSGGQSPRETWLRLQFVDAGFPRPATQIRVTENYHAAILDMGWEDLMIGVDYDGDRHRTDRRRYVHDIGRNELVRRQGWLDLHVVAEHSRSFIIHRAADAFARRGHPLRLRQGS